MWIRVGVPKEQKEIVFDMDKIWKIEALYIRPPAEGTIGIKTTLNDGATNENVIRWYKLYVGTEVIDLPANPTSKAMQIIADIYNNAIKE
ncbi:MAG TPA: hypothetical protein VGP76_02430 [Planctomycetaceae bacterium]|jgi:hypothetical protein|nr:hypothetical protein [Planctomycetaceae bacterium]